jgi:hypothetical protein
MCRRADQCELAANGPRGRPAGLEQPQAELDPQYPAHRIVQALRRYPPSFTAASVVS